MQLHAKRTTRGTMQLLAFAALTIMMTRDSVISGAAIETTEKPPKKVEQPPHVFPEDETKYIIFYNNSSLLTSDGKGTPTASSQEIYEVLHAPQLKEQANKNDALKLHLTSGLEPELGRRESQRVGWNPKLQIEMIQEPGAVVDRDKSKSDKMTQPKANDQSGRRAALVAGIILAVAVAVYVGLVFFRKRLERKYGSRHILVNEEENGRNF